MPSRSINHFTGLIVLLACWVLEVDLVNSRNKGCVGEREFVHFLRERGFKARRGQQYSGTETTADIISELPFHFEVKRRETFSLYPSIEQAKSDCGNGTPVVVHRKSRKPWVVVMYADDFLELVNARARYLDRS